MKKSKTELMQAIDEFVLLGSLAPPQLLEQTVKDLTTSSIAHAEDIPKKQLANISQEPDKVIDFVLSSNVGRVLQTMTMAAATLGLPKYGLIRTMYLTGKSPYKIFSDGEAPEGIRKKSLFNEAVKDLVKQKLIIMRKGKYLVNTRFIEKTFGPNSVKYLFETELKNGKIVWPEKK